MNFPIRMPQDGIGHIFWLFYNLPITYKMEAPFFIFRSNFEGTENVYVAVIKLPL